MTALAIFLTALILSGATFLGCVAVSEHIYRGKEDPVPLRWIGVLSAFVAVLSLLAALITIVWVVLT